VGLEGIEKYFPEEYKPVIVRPACWRMNAPYRGHTAEDLVAISEPINHTNEANSERVL
jgi:hypothetical protein